MILTKEQRDELLKASKPLIAWLNENCHPHCTAMVENDRVELLEGVCMEKTNLFLKD